MAIAEPAAMANATPEKYEQRRPEKTVLLWVGMSRRISPERRRSWS